MKNRSGPKGREWIHCLERPDGQTCRHLAALTGLDAHTACGKLAAWWFYCLHHAVRSRTGVTIARLNELVGMSAALPGRMDFAQACVECGLIRVTDAGEVCVRDYDARFGAKARARAWHAHQTQLRRRSEVSRDDIVRAQSDNVRAHDAHKHENPEKTSEKSLKTGPRAPANSTTTNPPWGNVVDVGGGGGGGIRWDAESCRIIGISENLREAVAVVHGENAVDAVIREAEIWLRDAAHPGMVDLRTLLVQWRKRKGVRRDDRSRRDEPRVYVPALE